MISAKVIADSLSPDGVRLTTVQARIHRFILPEITRHRVFSFSVGSSRAVPTKKIIEQVKNDPAMPVFWGKNQPGMVADEECDEEVLLDYGIGHNFSREETWEEARDWALIHAKGFREAGYHKQLVNRLLEPFQWCDLIMTGTEWDNFFSLRIDCAAQPEIREAAIKIRKAMNESTPTQLKEGQWHRPYVDNVNDNKSGLFDDFKMNNISAARVARVSYLNHDQTSPNVSKDLKTANRLLKDHHWSPFEHMAKPLGNDWRYNDLWPKGMTHVDHNADPWSGNLKGWVQYRQLLEEV